MGEIIGAGVVSHVPTLMLPEEVRLELNEGKELSIVTGLHRLRREVLDELAPDTIIVLDTHWMTTFEFVLSGHARRTGKYTSSELPRGMRQVPYDLPGNPELAEQIAKSVRDAGIRCIANDDPCIPIFYGTVNLAHYLHRGEQWISFSICQTGQDKDYLTTGAALGKAIENAGEKVVLLASGGLSHRFWPMQQLDQHEASDPINIVTPEARVADEQRVAWWEAGDHVAVIDSMDEYRAHAPEGFFGHYLMMIAALGGRACSVPGRRFSDYESTAGTGQVHMWFDRPAAGWS